MEIEGTNGSKTHLKPNSTTVFGRGNGFFPNDLAVSRRHISFDLTDPPDSQTSLRVSFEVLGKNPVWVYSKKEDGKIRAFKRFQRGELGTGDKFCVSAKDPVWFTVKEVEDAVNVDEKARNGGKIGERVNAELSQSLETASGFKGNGDFELDYVDVSNIDPVKEFGFLVIGHEFDHYPKQMIRDIKEWDWFLEDPRGDSDDEDNTGKRSARRKRKKTKGDDDEDEEWTDKSEDDEMVTTKARKARKPNYQTRSKDRGKPNKDRKDSKSSAKTSDKEEEEEDEDEDEDDEDETLGGFIVDDVETDNEEEEVDDEEEEEEFIEDEDELEE